MKKIAIVTVFSLFFVGFAAVSYADLSGFLSKLNAQAQSDIKTFNSKLAAQFGLPLLQVQAIVKTVEAPADAFMCLQLSRMAQQQPETVVQTYKRSKGKGWGAIAKELGIKPGSPEFHALKRGDFAFTGNPGGGDASGPGRGNHGNHGRGKGRNK
jgi:hypothetical protein